MPLEPFFKDNSLVAAHFRVSPPLSPRWGYAGIVDQTINNSAAYIEGWLDSLRDDRTLIVSAAAQAQKAADFILGRSFNEPEQA